MEYKKEWMKKNSRKKLLFVVCILFLIAVTTVVISVYLQILQQKDAVNHSLVYCKNLMVQALGRIAAGLFSFAAFFVSGVFAKRNCVDYFKKTGMTYGKLPVIIPSITAGVITAVLVNDLFYRETLLFFNAVSFNVTDPVFGRDVGYYIFQRPFLMSLQQYLFNLWIFLTIYIVGFYTVNFAMTFSNLSFRYLKIDTVLTHNLVNAGVLFVLLALSFPFERESFLFQNVVDNIGESFVHVKVWIPYYSVMTVALPLLVILSFFFFRKGKYKKAVMTFGVIPFLWVAVMVSSFIVKETVVKPNAFVKESEYIGYNIRMTKKAYGLENMTVVENQGELFSDPEYTKDDVENLLPVPVVDEGTVLSFYVKQSEGSFYIFNDFDLLDTEINGEKTLVYAAVREINHAALQDKSYINSKYRYTHGYGLLMYDATNVNELKSVVTVPEIYYGELTYDYVIVNASGINEIDYTGNTEHRYLGDGGIPLNLLNRILFAVEYRDMKLLTSDFSKNATLLTNRQIVKRAQIAAPFLETDKDPYPVLDGEGRILWVLDGYTCSGQYPFSRYSNGINYIRPSVKIVIDAYNGHVKYYVTDLEDPLIRAYMNIYPFLFEEEPLPYELTEYIKYPEYMFKIQSDLLKKYHLTEDQTESFYTQNDVWGFAKTSSDQGSGVLKEKDPETVHIIPPYGFGDSTESVMMRMYTPSENRHDLTAYVTVGNGVENYGKLTLVYFPRNDFVLGPYQAEIKMKESGLLTDQISLLSKSGFSVDMGNTMVLPFKNRLLYLSAIRVKSSGAGGSLQIPYVVIGYQQENDFVYGIGNTFFDAWENLLIQEKKESDVDNVDETDDRITDLMNRLNDLKKQLDDLQSEIEKLYNEREDVGKED